MYKKIYYVENANLCTKIYIMWKMHNYVRKYILKIPIYVEKPQRRREIVQMQTFGLQFIEFNLFFPFYDHRIN